MTYSAYLCIRTSFSHPDRIRNKVERRDGNDIPDDGMAWILMAGIAVQSPVLSANFRREITSQGKQFLEDSDSIIGHSRSCKTSTTPLKCGVYRQRYKKKKTNSRKEQKE